MKKGPPGLFDVYVDEGVIYSNRREGGRLPSNAEVIEKIREYLGHAQQPSAGDREAESGSAAAQSGCT